MNLDRVEKTTQPETDPDDHTSAPQHKLLLVDDNPTNLGILSTYLTGAGYQLLVAHDGEAAVHKAQQIKPDIILLDIMMPGIDGFETCRRLKSDESTKEIPVIFMTTLSDTKDKVRAFQVGGVDYITKPLQYEEALVRIGTHLNIRNLTRYLQAQNVYLQQMAAELQVANEALSKRNVQLQVSSEVGQHVTSILDLNELLNQVVALIQAKFGYYFVGVWLINAQQDRLLLQAGAAMSKNQGPQPGYQIEVSQGDSPIVKVSQNCRYEFVEDLGQEHTFFPFDTLLEAKSELALPLRTSQQVVGVLDIISDQVAAFTQDDRVGLQTLADQIAIAIRNAQLYEVEQQRRRLAESLEHIGRVLSPDLDLRQVPRRILDELAGVVPYQRGSVFLQKGAELQSVAKRGYPSKKDTSELQVTIDEGGVFQRMTQTLEPVLVDDVTHDRGWQQLAWLPLHYSWLGVPLISRDRVIGMISLTRRSARAFSEEDAHSVMAFAGQAAVALENARLFDEINQFNEHLEQKVAERTKELNRANKMLERLDKTKNDFINVTSHELRTPLSVIKGYTQILTIMPINDDPDVAKLISGMNQGVNRLHQIVDTMLDVVKIDTQLLQVRPETTNLHDVLVGIKEMLQPALEERRHLLTLIDLETLPLIEANPDLIHKVFYNLVINAIKYTPDDGSIMISGQVIEEVQYRPTVEIMVSDSGIGIDPEHHEQIFEKFYQTGELAFHSTGQTKFKGGGPGLGLAIVRGIIKAHNGQVWVESAGYNEANNPGSHFYVRLPLKQLRR